MCPPQNGDDTNGIDDDDGDAVYRAQPQPSDIPGFVARALGYLRRESPDGDFTFETVEFEIAAGVWLAPIGVYDPADDDPSTPDEVAAGASPTGPHGRIMLDYAVGVRQAMHDAWGSPAVHTPRLVGSAQEPEGIIDYLLVAQDIAEAELWDQGDLFVAMLTDWSGEPGASTLRQILMVLPRELVMNGLGVFLDDDHTAHDRLMHGEDPLELQRRAWLMSALFGSGEVRVRDAPIEAMRYSLVAGDGTTTVWTFADDGRVLLLLHDPACEFSRTAAQQFRADSAPDDGPLPDAHLILVNRLLDGVPDDLRASIAARGETIRGTVAEHALEFGLLNGQPVPVISGAFWFDGRTWHATRALIETGKRNGFGMDDFGVATAMRRPYRLGGAFTVDLFAPADDTVRRQQLDQIFAACPYPEQPRPEGEVRLGYAIPSSADRTGIIDQIERATAAWWDRAPADAKLGDDTFKVGGRRLGRAGDAGVLTASIGTAERWTVDALEAWSDQLTAAMRERWGEAHSMRVHDERTGVERRTPLTRVMRGTGLMQGPLWWVNGHAVLVLAGMPDPGYSTDPAVIVVIARADTVLALLGRTSIWELRLRARVIRTVAALAAAPERGPAPPVEPAIAWDGPVLRGSRLVPRATRGGLRAGRFFWAWHFTHDGRGLLTSHEIGAGAGSFAEQQELFAGVPDDLLSLVVDPEPGGPYPTVTRETEPHGHDRLSRARTLPNAAAVFFHDGYDWRASEGMLLRVRADAATSGREPLGSLHSAEVGVPQLQWALRAGDGMSPDTLADPEYARSAFARQISRDEAGRAFAQLGTPLTASLLGSLNDLLDVIVDGPGYRHVLDAALSNPDPHRRRELALWLLHQDLDASSQLSLMTPVNVLLDNPTLDAGDAGVLRRLLESGAVAGAGLIGARRDGHPLVQLCRRDLDDADLLPLVDALLAAGNVDVTAPALPDGRSLLEYVRAGGFPGGRTRLGVLELLEGAAERTERPIDRWER